MTRKNYMGGCCYALVVVGLWVASLWGVISRFHPTTIKSNYPSVSLETHNESTVIMWDNLPNSKKWQETKGLIFQVFVSDTDDSECETMWYASNFVYVTNPSGSSPVKLPKATHYAVCKVGHPIPIKGTSRANINLPCYNWKWNEARFTTRSTCRFDEVGWVIFFMIVFVGLVVATICIGSFCPDNKVNPNENPKNDTPYPQTLKSDPFPI